MPCNMAKFDPEHVVVPDTNFGDRASAEQFLECGKFRPCANLLLPLAEQASPPIHVYVPICEENRFNKIGVAQHVPMPNPGSHTMSPITYTTVGEWAPFISCPRTCKGYQNKRWTALGQTLRKMFRGRQAGLPGTASANSASNWSRGEKIAGWTLAVCALALIAACLVIPEVRRLIGLDRTPSVAVTKPTPVQPPPNAKVFGVFAKNVQELRKSNNVKPIKEVESGKMLSEIPAGSYGFAGEAYIGGALQSSGINALELQPQAPLDWFELHKLSDGQIDLVGYVGPETLENVRLGLSQGEAITFYSDEWSDAANVVAVPLTKFVCSRARSILLDDPKKPKHRKILSALDCKVE